MARIPMSFYQKKRGARRTGSHRAASIGELIFSATILLLGFAGTATLWVELLRPEWEVNFQFAQGVCRATDCQVDRRQVDETVLYRPLVTIEYQVKEQVYRTTTYDIRGKWYEAYPEAAQRIATIRPGREYRFWFDRSDPRRAVLVRGYTLWFWMTLAIPLSFIFPSAGRLLYFLYVWRVSAERRANITKWRAAKRRVVDSEPGVASAGVSSARECDESRSDGLVSGEFVEWIPASGNLTNSPGTKLKYRLPTTREVFWTVGLMLTASILWNLTAIGTLIAVVSRQISLASPEWGALICAVILLLIGVGMVFQTWRLYRRWLGRGATIVEVSSLPLRSGESCDLYLSQSGRMTEAALEMFLICEETAIFGHGTNTRRETVRVLQEQVYTGESLTITPESPLEVRASLTIPSGAMHSFHSSHNRVFWQLLIRIHPRPIPPPVVDDPNGTPSTEPPGEPRSEGMFERRFPLLVVPGKPPTDSPPITTPPVDRSRAFIGQESLSEDDSY